MKLICITTLSQSTALILNLPVMPLKQIKTMDYDYMEYGTKTQSHYQMTCSHLVICRMESQSNIILFPSVLLQMVFHGVFYMYENIWGNVFLIPELSNMRFTYRDYCHK
uniref:Uncharacterized protein n=1 Tax=Cacopsylla melanoneura TaxID=428564 RepID=A0A8D8LAG8_9HEMI